ncbi:type IV secretory system conjugative DNA transfer family protein [Chamaesiphon minutus]|uniref:Type IV secretory pathway, VirD4 component n=1 Tax=Chamaesiphon minutus (strain ATCC 27169 / PCC 6605) TaxID=1173020 RepID=K9UPY3_CHAP6|nr:type IV secretion system DNA-binding domain-containing protein [Chamaesiphon minutus]AFY97142.1 type IV secretory pathway, VirD4 component [Chamaesiphon minutus PCC 6605]
MSSPQISTQTHQPVAKKSDLPFDSNLTMLFSAMGLLIILSMLGKREDSKQGKSYWGGSAQLRSARKIARSQIPAYSGKKGYTVPDACSLYLGTPAQIYNAHQQDFYNRLKPELDRIEREFGSQAAHQLEAKYRPRKAKFWDKTLYIPNAQQSIAVFGAAGLGKSKSILNPLIRSALDQRITTTVFDFKYPEQTKEIAGYAAQRGYKVQIIAPSYIESGIFNILDFIKDSGDSLGSGQISEVLTENTSKAKDSGGGSNEFFESGGGGVVQGGMLSAKWLEEDSEAIAVARRLWEVKDGDPHPPVADIMTVAALINLPRFGDRMRFAAKRINPWISQALAQFLSSGGERGKSNVTEGGILANAQKTINQLVKRDFIPALCGKSTIEIDLSGKHAQTLTIVGMNQDYRHVLSPLLATILDLLISRNIAHSRQRMEPFFVSLDELPSMKLRKISQWLAEGRSAGFCGVISLQNKSQLQETYGDDRTQTIMSNCATKFFMNPQDPASAKFYSEYLGEKEIRYHTKSTTTQKGGGSRSRNEHVAKVPLMEAAEFSKMPPGRAVIISPGYINKGKKEAYLPILQQIEIPHRDVIESEKSQEVWKTMLASFQARNIDEAEISRMFELRCQLVEELFPLPPPAQLAVPLGVLVGHLKFKGYSDDFDGNRSIDLGMQVNIPKQWQDPNSPDDAPIAKIPTDPKTLSAVVALVGSTGYKIVRKEMAIDR